MEIFVIGEPRSARWSPQGSAMVNISIYEALFQDARGCVVLGNKKAYHDCYDRLLIRFFVLCTGGDNTLLLCDGA